MPRTNGKSEVEQPLDAERELPSGDESEIESPASSSSTAAGDEGTELQRVKAERDTLLDRLARSQAEFDNARKRAAREQQEFRDFAAAETIKAILPIVDSFERALQTSEKEKSEFRGGIELIYKQLQDALTKVGVQPVPAKGEPFDPRVHEAIEMVDTTEAPDHQILQELQRGYKLRDRLLRPAMVRVARNSKH